MLKKRIRTILTISVTLVMLTAVVCALLTPGGRYRDRNKDKTGQEASDAALLPEKNENEIKINTVPVADDDAVRELHRALNLVLSDGSCDMDEVVASLSRSADLGNSDAMYFLGEIYFQGIGVETDIEKAGMYLRQACDSGNSKAMSIYGKMLFMGDGTVQDYDESASCFYTLADDDAEASYILGVMWNLGMGVPRSAGQAKRYVDQADASGCEAAKSYRGRIVDADGVPDGTEEFLLQAKEVRHLDYGTAYEDLQESIDAYHRMLKASESYSAFEDEMTSLLGADAGTTVLYGNNGYLFHQDENDGTSLHDYIGDNHFSREELETIAANLEREKAWIEKNGSQFALLLIPNKETMYPEWMPSYISRANETTRQDLLVRYLLENTDINVIYVKDTLMQNKERCPLYYRTDTHANMIGSLFMVSDLLEGCYGAKITPDPDKFEIHMQDYAGDLAAAAKCTGRYVDTVYFYPGQAVAEEEKLESSLMLVGDSFSEFVNMEAAYYMRGGVDHRMIADYEYDYHSATQAGFDAGSGKPEYVVWECVERYLDRLK